MIDCRFVLTEKIGPDAKKKLNSNNIMAYEISISIDEALKRLSSAIYENYHSNLSRNRIKASIIDY